MSFNKCCLILNMKNAVHISVFSIKFILMRNSTLTEKSLAYNLETLSPITHHSGSGQDLAYILAPLNVVQDS